MTAPLFLVDPGSLDGLGAGDELTLTGAEAHHAATVRRVAVGEEVIVGDTEGGAVLAVAGSVARDLLTLRVTGRRDEPEPAVRLVLVQALAKGGRDESAVEAATELGVDEVVPWQAARSIVRWREAKAEHGRERWCSVVTAAAKQSRRARLPEVGPLVTTRALAARLRQPGCVPFVLHEEATDPLATTELPGSGEVVLVVGPEGGIGDDELGALLAAGARPVRLGGSVLRSSTAGPAAIAVVSARGRWR